MYLQPCTSLKLKAHINTLTRLFARINEEGALRLIHHLHAECAMAKVTNPQTEILERMITDLVTYKATLLEIFGIDLDSDKARGFEHMPLFSE